MFERFIPKKSDIIGIQFQKNLEKDFFLGSNRIPEAFRLELNKNFVFILLKNNKILWVSNPASGFLVYDPLANEPHPISTVFNGEELENGYYPIQLYWLRTEAIPCNGELTAFFQTLLDNVQIHYHLQLKHKLPYSSNVPRILELCSRSNIFQKIISGSVSFSQAVIDYLLLPKLKREIGSLEHTFITDKSILKTLQNPSSQLRLRGFFEEFINTLHISGLKISFVDADFKQSLVLQASNRIAQEKTRLLEQQAQEAESLMEQNSIIHAMNGRNKSRQDGLSAFSNNKSHFIKVRKKYEEQYKAAQSIDELPPKVFRRAKWSIRFLETSEYSRPMDFKYVGNYVISQFRKTQGMNLDEVMVRLEQEPFFETKIKNIKILNKELSKAAKAFGLSISDAKIMEYTAMIGDVPSQLSIQDIASLITLDEEEDFDHFVRKIGDNQFKAWEEVEAICKEVSTLQGSL